MVDAREQLQAMRVERLAQPRLDLAGIAAGGQLDHMRNLSARGQAHDRSQSGQQPWRSKYSRARSSAAGTGWTCSARGEVSPVLHYSRHAHLGVEANGPAKRAETAHALVPVFATSQLIVGSKRNSTPVRADSWFVASAATTERLLLRAVAGLKQQPVHGW